jgi:hypothetical protein
MNNERIQVSHVEASSRVQAPEILITGGNSIKVYDPTNDKMGAISFQDADFIFYTDINGNQYKILRASPGDIGDGTIAHNSVVVHKNNVNETISGVKTFAQTGSFNTLQITNKKLSSYSLNSTNFVFGDNYLNFANSSSNLTGILPSGITSGINYYAKNLNSGIFFISGSGSRTIDGFSTLNLYKNESVQLVGVNTVGYTGWVTISADGGIS